MTVDEVRIAVDRISRMAGDDEAAHGAEDALHRSVLLAIALGAEDPRGIAFAALETNKIAFARWCA